MTNTEQAAAIITSVYEPATLADYDRTIEFEELEEMVTEQNADIMPYEIEEALKEHGFKEEASRLDFAFLVKRKQQPEPDACLVYE